MQQFLSFVVVRASLRNVNTRLTRSVCSSKVFENTVVSLRHRSAECHATVKSETFLVRQNCFGHIYRISNSILIN